MIRPLISFILFAIISVPVFSQQEISLSIKNGSRLLPDGGRIQAAANIGELTLVAWGTVGLTRDSGGLVVLRACLVRGAESLASLLPVHGDSARPFGAVAIVPLQDRFLVLWNDVRADRPGIYMRSVDTTGRPLGTEELFSPLPADSTGLRVFGRSGMRHALLWSVRQGSTPGIYMREIGVDGVPLGNEQRIGQSITLEKHYSFLPDMALIGVDAQPVFAMIDGRVDARRIPRSLFEGPFFIGADTSLATIVNGTFSFFFTVFDTGMSRRVRIDTLRGLIRGSIIITTDSTGGSLLYFTTLNDGPQEGVLITYRQPVSDVVGYPERIDVRVMSKFNDWNYAAYQYDGIIQKQGCDNVCYNDIRIYETHSNSFGYKEGYWNDYRYTVDSRGEYHRDDSLVPEICLPRDLPAVYRIASDGLSQIRMMRNDTAILLTDTIPQYRLSEPRRFAGLIERNNAIYVAWKETTGLKRSAVARWSPGTDSVLTLRSIWNPPHVGRGGYANVDGDRVYRDEEVFHTTFSGASMAVNGSRVDYYNSGHDPNSQGQDILNTAVLFYVATPGGWRGGGLTSKWEYPSQYRPDANYLTSSTNPNNGESVVAVTATWLPNLMFYGINPNGGVIWSMEYNGANQYLLDPFLPAEPSGVLVCGHSAARLMVDGKATATIQYPSVYGADYQRLFGPYFLRRYFTGERMLRLERYRMDGREAGSNSIELHGPVPMPFIVQSRSDSSFALLYNDHGQIRAAILDDSLRLVADTVVASPSASLLGGPVGIIRNDSLFVAWDDAHSGVADIYGAIVRIPHRRGIASVTDLSPSDISSDISIAPLPANDIVTIVLPSSVAGASLEMRDAFGRIVREKERVAPGGPLVIDVSALPDGVYLVVIDAGAESLVRKLIVLH
jgi:hypothetical protein